LIPFHSPQRKGHLQLKLGSIKPKIHIITVASSSFDILTRSITYTRVAIDMEISERNCSAREGNSSSGCTLQFTLCKAFLSTCSQLLNGTDTFGSYIEEIIIGVEISEEGLLYSKSE